MADLESGFGGARAGSGPVPLRRKEFIGRSRPSHVSVSHVPDISSALFAYEVIY